MRVVHATDIHWFVRPKVGRLFGKRFLGTANLYLRGRRHHFTQDVQAALVQAMVEAAPDAAVITGDLTAQALPEEFELAATTLAPLIETVPSLVQVGNHDVYTGGSKRSDRIRERFGPWLHRIGGGLARLETAGLTVVGMDPNRPHVTASGRLPVSQLEELPDALAAAPDEHTLLLALHYPVVGRDGALYDGQEHGLRNADALVRVLQGAPRRPDAILHGHVHHGYRAEVDLGDVRIPTFNPGSGGYAHLPAQDRAACFNVYEVSGRSVEVSRFRFDGTGFAPEQGGAYATGR